MPSASLAWPHSEHASGTDLAQGAGNARWSPRLASAVSEPETATPMRLVWLAVVASSVHSHILCLEQRCWIQPQGHGFCLLGSRDRADLHRLHHPCQSRGPPLPLHCSHPGTVLKGAVLSSLGLQASGITCESGTAQQPQCRGQVRNLTISVLYGSKP